MWLFRLWRHSARCRRAYRLQANTLEELNDWQRSNCRCQNKMLSCLHRRQRVQQWLLECWVNSSVHQTRPTKFLINLGLNKAQERAVCFTSSHTCSLVPFLHVSTDCIATLRDKHQVLLHEPPSQQQILCSSLTKSDEITLRRTSCCATISLYTGMRHTHWHSFVFGQFNAIIHQH